MELFFVKTKPSQRRAPLQGTNMSTQVTIAVVYFHTEKFKLPGSYFKFDLSFFLQTKDPTNVEIVIRPSNTSTT